MATLDSRGLVDDGSNNLGVSGLMTTAAWTMALVTTPGSGSVSLSSPSFYQVPATGSGTQCLFTGSLPNPATFPGGSLLVTDTAGQFAYLITGSVVLCLSGAAGGLMSLSSSMGTKLKVSAGGTVCFWSDSKGWIISAVSGTLTLSA